MKICRNCNREIPFDDAKFCPECGSKLPPPERFCTECGCEIDYSYKFCLNCGKKIGAVNDEQPIPLKIQDNGNATNKISDTDTRKHGSDAGFTYSVTVNYRLGGGNTVFSQSMGTLTFTQNEISFAGTLGSGNNHSYPISNIASTEFKVVRLGLSPNPGYVVRLKNGEEKIYIYSPFIKGQLVQADQAVKNLL